MLSEKPQSKFILSLAMFQLQLLVDSGQVDSSQVDNDVPSSRYNCPMMDIDLGGNDLDAFSGVDDWQTCGMKNFCMKMMWSNNFSSSSTYLQHSLRVKLLVLDLEWQCYLGGRILVEQQMPSQEFWFGNETMVWCHQRAEGMFVVRYILFQFESKKHKKVIGTAELCYLLAMIIKCSFDSHFIAAWIISTPLRWCCASQCFKKHPISWKVLAEMSQCTASIAFAFRPIAMCE